MFDLLQKLKCTTVILYILSRDTVTQYCVWYTPQSTIHNPCFCLRETASNDVLAGYLRSKEYTVLHDNNKNKLSM